MIILGIIGVLSAFGFLTGLIFIFFKKTRKIGLRLAPTGLILALCLFYIMGVLNPDSHKKTESTTGSGNSNIESFAEEDLSNSQDEDIIIQHDVDWSVNKGNVKFSIDQISIVKKDLESGDQGVIGVHMIIDNSSTKDISTYPTQGTLLTNTREQITASLHSHSFDGDIMSGAKTDGIVLFPVKTLNKPNDIKSVRVQWDFWPDKNNSEGLQELDAKLNF
ncbi:hypothetical protein CJZ71_15815 [Bacillus subtilis]|uniref:hypothetical protein n=1 Tax=Bacillus subtilis TaxID=1423 RepID=UPI0008531EE5|nr:hypothetical protein [Bacillus subtilis]AOS66808.1 hypothetical protein A4A60_03620 [Bacillus subtilis]ARW30307.1 hypothetical protein S101441_00737 [Bacillus subtilis subsp. subtilis]ASV03479.1 hypothetical protein CJZ71_15815 [Bacillus subtilis]AYK55910.1 hypothetical protein D9C10_01145 [Bacillus subtilis subsp. subtilis]AYK69555.1 hypothetical protein D9C09_07235 [Bacillus subtilis subsp. subtilis]